MREFFAAIVPWATLVFSVSSMLAVGLAHSVESIFGPLRRLPRVLRSLTSNFVFAPVLAFLFLRIFDLDEAHGIGLFLVGSAAGAPFLLHLARLARADVAFAASLLVLFLPVTVLFLAFVLPFVLPEAEVSAGAIALPLFLFLLLPLAVGLLARPLVPRLAPRLQATLNKLSTASLVVLFVSIVGANLQGMRGIGVRAILAAFCFVIAAFVLGWIFGSRQPGTREVVALGTAQRNIAAATVVATQSFPGVPGVLIMVTATTVVAWIVLFPIAFVLRAAPFHFPRSRHV